MKRKDAFLRYGISLLLTGIIAAQIPTSSNVAFAQGEYPGGDKDPLIGLRRVATVAAIALAGYGVYTTVIKKK